MNQTTPEFIGKYAIIKLLGKGSMGVVYQAHDPEIGRTVAVKVLKKGLMPAIRSTSAALERLRIEARSAGRLRHSNVVTIFEINRTNNPPFLVMDYIEGETLDNIIKRRGVLEPALMLHYVSQIASGLDYAHAQSVLHKDIKPANILVDPYDQAYILDFGVASFKGDRTNPNDPVLGSPAYMSPEQIRNDDLDGRSDLFSLAVITFECLTGKRPFQGKDFTTVVSNILSGKRSYVQQYVPALPTSVERVFDVSLNIDRNKRFDSGQEFIAALSEALALQNPMKGMKSGVRRRQLDFGSQVSETHHRSTATNIVDRSRASETFEVEGSWPFRKTIAWITLILTGLGIGALAIAPNEQTADSKSAEIKRGKPLYLVLGEKKGQEEKNTILPENLEKYIKDPSYLSRKAALDSLRESNDPNSFEFIKPLLADRDPEIRIEAAKVGMKINPKEAREPIALQIEAESVDEVKTALESLLS